MGIVDSLVEDSDRLLWETVNPQIRGRFQGVTQSVYPQDLFRFYKYL